MSLTLPHAPLSGQAANYTAWLTQAISAQKNAVNAKKLLPFRSLFTIPPSLLQLDPFPSFSHSSTGHTATQGCEDVSYTSCVTLKPKMQCSIAGAGHTER